MTTTTTRSSGDRFFSWTAGLGVVRGDGWLGGVAAGIAARLRIDPLIVRGVFVVAGLFGFPALFLYGIAWALLPDLDGRIVLQETLRRRYSPAIVGVAGCILLGLLPFPFALSVGLPTLYLGGNGGFSAFLLLALLAGVLVAGALLFFVVRAAVSAPRDHAPVAVASEQPMTASGDAGSSAASGSGPDAADPDGGDAAGFAASTPAPDLLPPHEPPAPSAPGDAEYAAWREQHAAWKVQDDAWRRQQQDATRLAREQARRERQERGAAFAAEAAERRRIRRAASPRTPFAYLATVLGIAVVAGALVAVTSTAELAGSLGLFTAALVVAIGMVIAGVVRRRSGFLAVIAMLLLSAGAAATAAPALQALHLGNYGISNDPTAEAWPASAPFVQPWGDVTVALLDTVETTRPIFIEKRTGWVSVSVDDGVALTVDITVPAGMLSLYDQNGQQLDGLDSAAAAEGRIRYTGTIISGDGAPTTAQTLVIDQGSGGTQIQTLTLTEDAR